MRKWAILTSSSVITWRESKNPQTRKRRKAMNHKIGTDATGAEALGNGTGVWICEGANDNTIGPDNVIAQDFDPGLTATVTLPGLADHQVTAIDPLFSYQQPLVADTVGGDLVIHDLLTIPSSCGSAQDVFSCPSSSRGTHAKGGVS
jgi:hypothetical protein